MKSGTKYLKSIRTTARILCQRGFLIWDRLACWFLSFLMISGFIWYCLRYTIPEEMILRQSVAETAVSYWGIKEHNGSHRKIIDRYNMQENLPRAYTVTYEDSWCAVFGSVIALEQDLQDIIPPECSCEQQITLFSEAGCWIETDWHLPKPGDYIFYDWNYATRKDSTGWSDHVGIVTKTIGPVIQVIEGNKDDSVSYRYLFLNDPTIRGFGVPDYGSVCFAK